MVDIPELFETIANKLWATYHNRPKAPFLIFPTLRSGSRRVSEQESKFLVCQELERAGLHYSVETPTKERYSQLGKIPLSARIDITIYDSSNPNHRIRNIELKAGIAKVEAFRKDFEKLLREATPGAWFHTIERTRSTSWGVLLNHALEAMRQVANNAEVCTEAVIFGFCELSNPSLAVFELKFGPGWKARFQTGFNEALASAIRPSWSQPPRRPISRV